MISRRTVLTGMVGFGALTTAGCRTHLPRARVVVVGGGFAGATCARTLKTLAPHLDVTLVEPQRTYTACPFSNLVLAGLRDMSEQQFTYDGVRAVGVKVVHDWVTELDSVRHVVRLRSGATLTYDRAVLAPGIDFRHDALAGYDEEAMQVFPHAWRAGVQTTALRDQLQAMPDNGTVAITVPESPYRCPPGPYERASLIAHYLKAHKPRAQLLVLDAKDQFSKQPLFTQAWAEMYASQIEWHGASDGGRVIEIDVATKTIATDFDTYRVDVGNVIPPQRAGNIAVQAGATDDSGWCPISAQSFASTRLDDVHVIGDAAIANAMPKSAFAANAQAKLAAIQIARLMAGSVLLDTKLINTCYSLVAPTYGISVAGVYRPDAERWPAIEGAGGTSPLQASTATRQQEAHYAHAWFDHITQQVFG